MIRCLIRCFVLFVALAGVFAVCGQAAAEPPLVALHPAEKEATSGAVTLLDYRTYAVLGTVTVKGDPVSVYFDPSGKSLVVRSSLAGLVRSGRPQGPWTVSVLDVDACTSVLSVDVGFSPILVATEALGRRQYILGGGATKGTSGKGVEGASILTVLDLAKGQVVASVKTAPGATGLSLSPGGRRLHVLYGANTGELKGLPGKLVVLDTETLTILKENDLAPNPFAMALGPDDKSLYVLSKGDKPKKAPRQPALSVIDVETGEVLARLDVGYNMLNLTVDRRRWLVYVLGTDAKGDEGLAVIEGTEIKGRVALETGYHGIRFAPDDAAVLVLGWESVYQVDPLKPSVVRTWPLEFGPAEILFDAPRKRAYVNAAADADVAEIDLAGGQVLASHKTGSKGKKAGKAIGSALLGITTGVVVYGWSVTDMVLRADGRFIYVINAYTDDLTIVDTGTHKIAGVLPTGGGTRRLVLPAATDYVYVEATDKISRVSTVDNRVVAEVPVKVEGQPRGAMTYDLPNHRAFIPKGNVVNVLDLGAGTTTATIDLPLPTSAVIVPGASTSTDPGPPAPASAPDAPPPYGKN